jgi:hypothetical protein
MDRAGDPIELGCGDGATYGNTASKSLAGSPRTRVAGGIPAAI